MKFKICNRKYDDYIIIEGETIAEIREKADLETEKRCWDIEDMYSEKID